MPIGGFLSNSILFPPLTDSSAALSFLIFLSTLSCLPEVPQSKPFQFPLSSLLLFRSHKLSCKDPEGSKRRIFFPFWKKTLLHPPETIAREQSRRASLISTIRRSWLRTCPDLEKQFLTICLMSNRDTSLF